MKKKVQFMTAEAISGRMPKWVKIMFDVSLLVTTVVAFVVSDNTVVDAQTALIILKWNAAGILFIRGLAKCFGLVPEEPQRE